MGGSMLTSCDETKATKMSKVTEVTETITPPAPDPVEILEKQVESEKQIRKAAEGRAEEASSIKDHWQLVTLRL